MESCPITNLPTTNYQVTGYGCRYLINYENVDYLIKLGQSFANFKNELEYIENQYLLAGAILNNQLLDAETDGIKSFSFDSDWENKLTQIIYPKTPKDKMDNLLKTLYLFQNYDGDEVSIQELVQMPAFWYKHFFKNQNECYFYFGILQTQNLIDATFTQRTKTDPTIFPTDYQLTLQGLNYYLNLTESGRLSNKCFVAMSFSKEMTEIREAIREAIEGTGFHAIIVDEQHIDSDTTINDRIIADLKGAKFCIADFTEQRSGVYFESGFALGQGKPVIYCCQKADFEKSHFDTKHFAHIIYENPSELKERLINKINAWIK